MALTVSNLEYPVEKKVTGLFSFDSNYTTGGMVIYPDRFGLSQFARIKMQPESGYNFEALLPNFGTVGYVKVYDVGSSGLGATISSVSAGTPAGTISAPTFTGNVMPTHAHTQGITFDSPFVVVANVATISPGFSIMQNVYVTAGGLTGPFVMIPSSGGPTPATGQVAVNPGTNTLTFNAADAVTDILVSYLNDQDFSVTAGSPTGTISVPIFTGSALATHTHTASFSGALNFAEVSNGTNLSSLSAVEFEVYGY